MKKLEEDNRKTKYLYNSDHVSVLCWLWERIINVIRICPSHILIQLVRLLPPCISNHINLNSWITVFDQLNCRKEEQILIDTACYNAATPTNIPPHLQPQRSDFNVVPEREFKEPIRAVGIIGRPWIFLLLPVGEEGPVFHFRVISVVERV